MTKKFVRIYTAFALITFILPCIIGLHGRTLNDTDMTEETQAVSASLPDRVSVYIIDKDEVRNMEFEEYIVGVLAGEMPASYEKEALKAQAVAARSYLKTRMSADSQEHHGAAVCTDPNHCEAWTDFETFQNKWGEESAKKSWKKFETAVRETKMEYMTCGGETVRAFFHSTSHGKTETPSDVWGGGDYSYLQSVESPWDETSPDFNSSVSVPVPEFCEKLGIADVQVGAVTYTAGGAVGLIEIGGIQFKGTDIRKLFGLRSACFTVTPDGENMTFSVKGFGHGVGMSQYGANCMAKEGKSYTGILKHYYTGVEIVS